MNDVSSFFQFVTSLNWEVIFICLSSDSPFTLEFMLSSKKLGTAKSLLNSFTKFQMVVKYLRIQSWPMLTPKV